jgi:hypothetical protein
MTTPLCDRVCGREGCGNLLDARHARFCCEGCRQQGSDVIAKNRFTAEMAAELYEDAKRGDIKVWLESGK